MATRLATQRSFVTINQNATVATTTASSALSKENRKQSTASSNNNNNNNSSSNNNHNHGSSNSNNNHNVNNSGNCPNNSVVTSQTVAGEVIAIAAAQDIARNTTDPIISQKKLILQSGNSGVTVVDVIPIETSDSSSPDVKGEVSEVTAIDSELSPSDSVTSSISQQVGAQVTVVHSPNDEGSPRYITVTVSTNENVGGQGSYQVQYVDPELYHNSTQGQSQMTYPFCAVGDYQSNNQSYYSTTGNYTNPTNTPTSHTSSLPYIVPVDESLLLATQSRESPQSLTAEVAYIQENHTTSAQQQTTASATATSSLSNSEPESTPNLSHATRISPATVSWLMENYETAEGVSLPRSTLYNHYMQHCNENKLEAVNAASFGKLIRSVFTGLRTRRLGTRGNSKYHYYGIRVKPGSALIQALEEKSQNYPGNSGNSAMNKGAKKIGSKPETYETCSQYLGDGTGAVPIFPNIDIDSTFPDEITLDDIEIFRSMYREHCELFLDAILNLEFSSIESLWRDFWHSTDNNNINDECEEEKYLNKTKLYQLCQCKSVQNFIKQVDYTFYQNMVEVLIPEVLRSIPNSLTQAIRNFAKNLEIWLTESMSGCPEKIVQIKTSAVSAFCQTLRRYTSLNHLAQAARAVLQNSSQISQMLNDLNRVDFHNVQEQAAWVCQCDTATVQKLENDFKAALQQQNSLEQWAAWLRLVVDSALEEYQGKPNYAKAARQFLLKWSFYSSMVIRDLTLRSASSFGSFHLIRLLYDEYMFFLIEHKVAEAQNTTAIAVMSDKMQKNPEFEFDMYSTDFDEKMDSSPQTNKRPKQH